MRIIAGKWRSRRLLRPDTPNTRPPPDRVKESVFNVLGHHYGTLAELPPLHVADVFAGSGAFGLEALSRGAAHCTFIERERAALEALRQNVRALGAESDCLILTTDAWRSLSSGPKGGPFPLVFLDPPYRESLDTSPTGSICEFLTRLPFAPDGTLVVLHHPATVDWAKTGPPGWSVADARHIGTNGITIFAR
jgi:16S rRNA (guanine966-N2)-methyltransferase